MKSNAIPAVATSRAGKVPFCASPAEASRVNALKAAAQRVHALAAARLAALAAGHPTVRLNIWGGDTVTEPEPEWCDGRHRADDARGEHPEDISHASAETPLYVTRASGGKEILLSAWLLQYPYSRADFEPRAAVCMPTGDCEDYDSAGLGVLAAKLAAAAAHVAELQQRLAAIERDARR